MTKIAANKLLEQIKALKGEAALRAPKLDEKDFGIGAQMIHAVGIMCCVLVLRNRPKRVVVVVETDALI